MKGNGLVRSYHVLTADERFRLVLEAMGREDDGEVQRLAEASPCKTYVMADLDYLEMIDCSRLAVLAFTTVWLDANRAYRLAEIALRGHRTTIHFLAHGYVRGANTAWKAAGKKGLRFAIDGREPTPEEAVELMTEGVPDAVGAELEGWHQEAASRLKGVYEGFCRLCDAATIEQEKLLAWNKAVMEEIEEMRELLDGDIPVNEDMAGVVYRQLCKLWPGVDEAADAP